MGGGPGSCGALAGGESCRAAGGDQQNAEELDWGRHRGAAPLLLAVTRRSRSGRHGDEVGFPGMRVPGHVQIRADEPWGDPQLAQVQTHLDQP
jgi:hypothetical protein